MIGSYSKQGCHNRCWNDSLLKFEKQIATDWDGKLSNKMAYFLLSLDPFIFPIISKKQLPHLKYGTVAYLASGFPTTVLWAGDVAKRHVSTRQKSPIFGMWDWMDDDGRPRWRWWCVVTTQARLTVACCIISSMLSSSCTPYLQLTCVTS
jgi:hypothetical protein